MDLRARLIDDWRSGLHSMTELCREYDVSRKTAYKWVQRFEEGGRAALADRSRRPHRSPAAVPDAMAVALCDARRRKPLWGPAKIRQWLVHQRPLVAWPSRVTIAAVWRRAGLQPPVRPRRWRPRGLGRPRTAATAPNVVWTVDFKGDFRLGNGTRCYPLTVRDLASRYALQCVGLPAPDGRLTQRWLERAFAQYGLPSCIRSDNGEPFAGPGLAGLSRLNITWLRLGIRVEQIAPGRPEQNGSHEQFHRVLKAATTRPPAATLRAQQRRFHAFCREYNDERPHEALAGAVPADHYQPSSRQWPTSLPAVEYPGEWESRLVHPNGRIAWHHETIFLSRALAGERVALEEIDDGLWTVHFATVPLARWCARTHRLRPIRD